MKYKILIIVECFFFSLLYNIILKIYNIDFKYYLNGNLYLKYYEFNNKIKYND